MGADSCYPMKDAKRCEEERGIRIDVFPHACDLPRCCQSSRPRKLAHTATQPAHGLLIGSSVGLGSGMDGRNVSKPVRTTTNLLAQLCTEGTQTLQNTPTLMCTQLLIERMCRAKLTIKGLANPSQE